MADAALKGLNNDNVHNIYLFLADTIRYDMLPQEIKELGISFKTVAHALSTPQIVPTILSGLLPHEHGMEWFYHTMDEEIETMMDLEGINTGYLAEWSPAIPDIFGNFNKFDLTSISEPFVAIEHDRGGHSPYPHTNIDNSPELLRQIDSKKELVNHYRESLEECRKRFEKSINILKDRGILENTLIIFTADHGELLDERGGFFGHGLPMTPEVVYVPTVFIHPSLPTGITKEHLIQQIDYYPTICNLLTGERHSTNGADLTNNIDKNRPAYSWGHVPAPSKLRNTYFDPVYESEGIWMKEGGHVFAKNPKLVRIGTAIYQATMSGNTGAYNSHKNTINNISNMLKHHLQDYCKYGSIKISKEEALEYLRNVDAISKHNQEHELSQETKEQLADLGYH